MISGNDLCATPPVPVSVRRMIVYGGTFDPPHRAHVELPTEVRAALEADWVLYVPALRSPLKERGGEASGEDRCAMLEAALRGRDGVSVSRMELDRTGDAPSYTVDTLERIATARPGVELRLLIGADQAITFHRWREPRRVMELAPPAVMLREPAEDVDALMNRLCAHWSAEELERWRSWTVPVRTIDVSATRIRALLADGDPAVELAAMVPERVLDLIRQRGLYR